MKSEVTCPNCRGATRLDQTNPWRPFCSQRCKLIDLGEWFEENRGFEANDQSPGNEPGNPEDLYRTQ